MNADLVPQPLRVVVVDDTADLRALLRLALERGGYEVVAEAGDGRQAIEVAGQHRPDVILLDLAMPVMDGLEALPTLRQLCPRAKIVVLSGFGAAQMTRRALAAGADGYLQKGIPVKQILGYVADLVEESSPPPPRTLTVVPDPPPDPHPSLPEGVTRAPFGVVELVDEPIYRVVTANDAAGRLLGRGVEPGTPLFATHPGLASQVQTHRASEDAFQVEGADGPLSATLRGAEGSVFLFLAEVTDPDDLRRRVASTAHEVRGPVAVIAGLVEAIGALGPDQASERQRLLDAVAHQARLLDSVTSDLLTDASARQGELRLRPATVHPAAVAGMVAVHHPGTTVEVADPRPVTADPDRLEQVLVNLLTNAEKYAAPPVVVRIRRPDDATFVAIDVVDHGAGVPPDFVDRLWDDYTRAEGTDADGSGLGLSVVRRIVEAHGGTASYSPGDEGGSVFTVTFPAAP